MLTRIDARVLSGLALCYSCPYVLMFNTYRLITP